jgi:hypothetical protein
MTPSDQTTPVTSPDFIRTTPHARLCLAGLLLLTLVLFLLGQFVAIPYIIKALNTIPPTDIAAVKGTLLAFTCIAALAGICIILQGRKVWLSRQYPLDHAWAWRDTPIQRGRNTVKFAYLHIVIGLLIFVIGIGVSSYLWPLLDQSAPSSTSTGKTYKIIPLPPPKL